MWSGTLRENVDPLGNYDDSCIKDALAQVGMAHKALDAEVGTSGAGWSVGEKQLVSINLYCLLLEISKLHECLDSRLCRSAWSAFC